MEERKARLKLPVPGEAICAKGGSGKSFWAIVKAREEASKAGQRRPRPWSRIDAVGSSVASSLIVLLGYMAALAALFFALLAKAIPLANELASNSWSYEGIDIDGVAPDPTCVLGAVLFGVAAMVIGAWIVWQMVRGERAMSELEAQRARLVELSGKLMRAYDDWDGDPNNLVDYANEISLISLGAYDVTEAVRAGQQATTEGRR